MYVCVEINSHTAVKWSSANVRVCLYEKNGWWNPCDWWILTCCRSTFEGMSSLVASTNLCTFCPSHEQSWLSWSPESWTSGRGRWACTVIDDDDDDDDNDCCLLVPSTVCMLVSLVCICPCACDVAGWRDTQDVTGVDSRGWRSASRRVQCTVWG